MAFAKDKLTFAVVNGREHVIDYSLSDLCSKLDARRFVRIHRAAIVNIAFVQELHPSVDEACWYGSRTSARPSSPWPEIASATSKASSASDRTNP
jgi:hypothetical protein